MPHNYSSMSDLDLAAIYYHQPDQKIIAEFYERYKIDVYKQVVYWNFKYCKGNLNQNIIEDTVTEVFAKLIRQLARYEINSNFRAWLMSLARGLFIDMLPKETKHQNALEEKNLPIEVENDATDRLLEQKGQQWIPQNRIDDLLYLLDNKQIDIEYWIAQCIESLPNEEQKTCLYWFFIEKCPYKTICEKTGFDVKKVKSALQYGKINLQKAIIKAAQTLL